MTSQRLHDRGRDYLRTLGIAQRGPWVVGLPSRPCRRWIFRHLGSASHPARALKSPPPCDALRASVSRIASITEMTSDLLLARPAITMQFDLNATAWRGARRERRSTRPYLHALNLPRTRSNGRKPADAPIHDRRSPRGVRSGVTLYDVASTVIRRTCHRFAASAR